MKNQKRKLARDAKAIEEARSKIRSLAREEIAYQLERITDNQTLEEAFFTALRDPLKIDGKPLSDSETAIFLTLEARFDDARGHHIDSEKTSQFYARCAANHRADGNPITARRLETISNFYARKTIRTIIPFSPSDAQGIRCAN